MGRISLLVSEGGSLKSIARYLLAIWPKHFLSSFLCGTFAAIILSRLLIGVVYVPEQFSEWLTPELHLFIASGLWGGFITFLSLTLENINLLKNSNSSTFALCTISIFAVGLLVDFGKITLTII